MHVVTSIVLVTRITPWHNHPVCRRVVIPVRGSHLRLHSNIASVCVPVISKVFRIYLSRRLASINHCHPHRRHHLGCLHLDTRWRQSRWRMRWGWSWPMAIPSEKRGTEADLSKVDSCEKRMSTSMKLGLDLVVVVVRGSHLRRSCNCRLCRMHPLYCRHYMEAVKETNRYKWSWPMAILQEGGNKCKF